MCQILEKCLSWIYKPLYICMLFLTLIIDNLRELKGLPHFCPPCYLLTPLKTHLCFSKLHILKTKTIFHVLKTAWTLLRPILLYSEWSSPIMLIWARPLRCPPAADGVAASTQLSNPQFAIACHFICSSPFKQNRTVTNGTHVLYWEI